jgi:predicted Zn-dependent protease
LKSLRIEPENTGAMIGLAQLYMADGELKEAKQLCVLALFWRPEKPNVLRIASECFLRWQDADSATPVLEKLVVLAPEDAKAWFNLSLCRQSCGDAEGQVQALRQVLKISPEDSQAIHFLAQALGSNQLRRHDCGLLRKVGKTVVQQ